VFNLVITVIAIALLAAFLVAGTNYVNVDKINGYIQKQDIQAAVTNIGSAITEFYIYNDRNPSSINELYPGYIRSLQSSRNLSFSALKSNLDGTLSICLTGNAAKDELTGLLDIQDDAHSSPMVIGENCWDTSNTIPTGNPPHAIAVSIDIR
jgi:competence protein ComGC